MHFNSQLILRTAELTEWSRGDAAKADANKISVTAKSLRNKVKDIARMAVTYGYELHEALETQTQTEISLYIQGLLHEEAFLDGDIEVSYSSDSSF